MTDDDQRRWWCVAPMNQKWNNKKAYTKKCYFPPFFSKKIKIQKTGAKTLNIGIELLSLRISMIAAIFFFRSHRQTTIFNAQRRLRNYENVKHCDQSERNTIQFHVNHPDVSIKVMSKQYFKKFNAYDTQLR